MRQVAAITLLFCGGCLNTQVKGFTTAATSSGVTAAASTSGSTGAPTSGGSTTGSNGSGTTGGSSTGSLTLPSGPCGPGTAWVGDVCVAVSCADAVSPNLKARCELPDGGFGTCYGGACVAPNDPFNCGGLGIACPISATCEGSTCVSDAGAFPTGSGCFGDDCPSGFTCIEGGGCVLPSCADAGDGLACEVASEGVVGFCCGGACAAQGVANCGGCNTVCPSGSTCAISQSRGKFRTVAGCVPTQSCGAAGTSPYGSCGLDSGTRGFCCGADCLDSNDSDNCGICGRSCGVNDACELGVCNFGVTSCGYGLECPPGDLCGWVPAGGMGCYPTSCTGSPDTSVCMLDGGVAGTCQSGACVIPSGCEGADCGFADCAVGGSAIDYAACSLDAGTFGTCCEGACVDLASDANCSICGLACPPSSICGASIGKWACIFDAGCVDSACPAGEACVSLPSFSFSGPMGTPIGCFPTTCNGSNTECSLDGGPGQCCGTTCAPTTFPCGASCPKGAVPAGPTTEGCIRPDGGEVCNQGAICPSGTICSNVAGACVPLDLCAEGQSSTLFSCPFGGGGFDTEPGQGGTCCGPLCTDVLQDPKNCGGCGNVCSSGICESSQCVPAGATSDCGGPCPEGTACLDGLCIDGSCEYSSYCLAANGTIGICCGAGSCAHPIDDPDNCGACGNVCGPTGVCINGSCSNFGECGVGRMSAYCDVDAGPDFICCPGTGCTHVMNDPANCRYCGGQCEVGQVCVGGLCQDEPH